MRLHVGNALIAANQAAAVALILAMFVSLPAFPQIVALCVGDALLIADRALRRHNARRKT